MLIYLTMSNMIYINKDSLLNNKLLILGDYQNKTQIKVAFQAGI